MSKKAQDQEVEQRQEKESAQADERAAGEEIVVQFEALRKERDEYRDLLQRKQAEFENYRKRTAKEREGLRVSARAEVVRLLLPVLDGLEKGLESMAEDHQDPLFRSYRQGYELLGREIRGVLQTLGVEVISTRGRTFDPQLHEAVMREMTQERPDGEILEEFRKGYVLNDILLRPSQVKVAARPSGEPPKDLGLVDGEEPPHGEQVDIKA